MTRVLNAHLSRNLLWGIAFAVVIGLSSACNGNETPEIVEINVYSSSTKEDWINASTESFNGEQFRTASGKQIVVQVTQVNSGRSKQAIVAGDIEPTVWSPGDISWVDKANQEWHEKEGQSLISSRCQPTVYEPTGFAMWRPMAEALGWPDSPISWSDLLDLLTDPRGWARYDHPEWGQLKLGLTRPESSNSGLLIMTALAYAMLGETRGLTPEQVMSDPVAEAMRQLGAHTSEYGVQSARLLERMVTGGPSQLHVVNTNEAETLKSNARYGNLLPFPLVFVFPADGTFWAEHPFCIPDTDWVTEEERMAARLFTSYLLELQQQELAVDKGLRPTNSTVPLHNPITLENGTDPRVGPGNVPALDSPSAAVVEAIQALFLQTEQTEEKRP